MEHTKSDIAIILKKNKRTIQYWTDFGLVMPDISPSMGKGKARVYSDKNLVQFAMVEYLGQLGVELITTKDVMDGLRKGYMEMKFDEEIVAVDDNEQIKKARMYRYEFFDFFESRAWGEEKELAFLFACNRSKTYSQKAKKHLFHDFHMFQTVPKIKSEEDYFSMGRFGGSLIQKVLWLGQIKIAAVMDLLGMESLLSTV
jgi:DNA-binding transcriptional MerR regulator